MATCSYRVRTKLLSQSTSDVADEEVRVVRSVDRYQARLEQLEGSDDTRELTAKEYLSHVGKVSGMSHLLRSVTTNSHGLIRRIWWLSYVYSSCKQTSNELGWPKNVWRA